LGTNPYTAGVFYSGSFIVTEFIQDFPELGIDRRLAVLAEISPRPQVSQLIIQRVPYVIPTVENYQSGAFSYFRVTSPGGVLTGTTTPTQFADKTDQYVNTATPPAALVFTDPSLGFHYVTSDSSNVLSSSSTQPVVPLDRLQYVGEYLEMIAEDGISIYRITVSASNVISTTLDRTEPQRAATIRISNGHPFAYDGVNLWLEGLVSIGDVSMSVEQYKGGYAGVSVPRVGTVSIQLGDQWFAYLIQQSWDTRTIEIKVGLADEDIGSYRVILRAKTERAEADLDGLTIVLRDHSVLFDRSIQANTYAGTGGYDGDSEVLGVNKPLTFGFVRHITPVCINSVLHLYQVHDGAIHQFNALYSGAINIPNLGGVPSGHTDLTTWVPTTAEINVAGYRVDYAKGMFRLSLAPIAPVHLELWGDTGISRTTISAAEVCRVMIQRAAPECTIDQNSFDAFQTEHIGGHGIYIKDEMTLRAALNAIIQPIGAIIRVNSLGVVSIQRLRARDPVAVLGEHNIFEDAVPSKRTPPKAGSGYRLGHYKNWTLLSPTDFLLQPSGSLGTFLQREFSYKVLTWYGTPNTRLPHYDSTEVLTIDTLMDNTANVSAVAAFLAFRDHSFQGLYDVTVLGFSFRIQVGDTVLFQVPTLGTRNLKTGIVVEVIEKALTSTQEDLTQLLVWA